MKRIMSLTAFAALLIGYLNTFGYAAGKTSIEINKATQAISFNGDIDTAQWESVSAQLVYSTANLNPQHIRTGIKPFINMTVSDWRQVQGRRSTMTFTIPFGFNSASVLSSAVITINGQRYVENEHWAVGHQSSNTIQNLVAAVTNYTNGEYTATASTNVMTVTAVATGSFANAWFGTTSTGTAIKVGTSSTVGWMAPFTNGNDHGYFSINGITLTEGTSFYASDTASTTAKSISNAIVNHLPYVGVVVSSWASGVVYATSTYNSATALSVSPGPGLSITRLSVESMTPNVNEAENTITIPGHSFGTGLAVLLATNSPNIAPTGLIDKVTYYAIVVDENVIKLASSQVNAIAGTAIDISTLPVNNSISTMTPVGYLANANSGFEWKASNDRANWSTLAVTSVSWVSIAGASSLLWDFSATPYRYLRAVFNAPTFGANMIKIIIYGKEQ